MNLLKEIWHWEIQPLPVLFSIILFETPAIIRRLKKLYYVPIYFSVFPLRELNQDLLNYYNNGDFLGNKERLTLNQLKKLRKKIRNKSILSMLLSAVLTPLLIGFISAFYLDKNIFIQFILIFVIYKVFFLVKSIYQFHLHAIATAKNRVFLGLIYISYMGVVFEMLRTSYFWTVPYVQSRDFINLFSDLSSFVFGKILVASIIISLLNGIFVSKITESE